MLIRYLAINMDYSHLIGTDREGVLALVPERHSLSDIEYPFWFSLRVLSFHRLFYPFIDFLFWS